MQRRLLQQGREPVRSSIAPAETRFRTNNDPHSFLSSSGLVGHDNMARNDNRGGNDYMGGDDNYDCTFFDPRPVVSVEAPAPPAAIRSPSPSHTLSIHPLNPHSQSTLSTHLLTPPSNPILLTPSVTTLSLSLVQDLASLPQSSVLP